MNSEAAVKTWEKTKLQNLVRHKSGKYYARLYLKGKEVWKSLKTAHFSVAQGKLAELQKEHRQLREKQVDLGNAKMTFQQVAEIHMHRLEERVTIKTRTRQYWKEILAALLKSWPELATMEVRKISVTACQLWAARYAKVASSTRYNNTLSMLRHIIDVAKENGVIYNNPADRLDRVKVRPKQLELPTIAQFVAFIAEMRNGHGRDSKNCADLAEALAYTGVRIGESAEISWQDVDFENEEVTVKGDPEEGTKNSEIRRVPMIPQVKELLQRMKLDRKTKDRTERVFLVNECQKSMDRAATKVGMTRITHHDLRHFFATVCIENGVDIPTVSRWLGHKDGGALAMKTYGHLRREHSAAQAKKVSFAAVTPGLKQAA